MAAADALVDLEARRETPAPSFTRDGDDLLFTVPQYRIGVGVSRIHETSSGITAELTIISEVLGPLSWGHLNLASTSQRDALIKKLEKRYGTPPQWDALIERVCRQTADEVRRGAPIVPLSPVVPTGPHELVERLLPAEETTILYGDGGSGKSMFALAVALAVTTGTALPCGLRPSRRATVLYIDYETTKTEHEERLHALVTGLGVTYTGGIFYRPMIRPLADDAPLLRAERTRLGIDLFIIDSLAPAAMTDGPDSWHGAAIATLNAMRSLGPATRLAIAHVTKAAADQRAGPARIFGSAFNFNLARAVWELKAAEDDEAEILDFALYHRKANRGRKHPPLGLRFEFGAGSVRLRSHDLGDHNDLLARASVSYRLHQALLGGEATTDELAEVTKIDVNTVRRTLNRMRVREKVVRLDGVKPGKAGRWGLAVRP